MTAIAAPLALALATCGKCRGLGNVRERYGNGSEICPCVYRRVYRDCVERAWRLREEPLEMARRPMLKRAGVGLSYGFGSVEFVADLESVAKRALCRRELLAWKYHVLAGLDWRHCLPPIGRGLGRPVDRGEFFHSVYRMERQLGRAWLECGVWPRDYFGGAYFERGMIGKSVPVRDTNGDAPLRLLVENQGHKHERRDARWVGGPNSEAPGEPLRAGGRPHFLSDPERALSERVDAWMVA